MAGGAVTAPSTRRRLHQGKSGWVRIQIMDEVDEVLIVEHVGRLGPQWTHLPYRCLRLSRWSVSRPCFPHRAPADQVCLRLYGP